MPVYVIVTEITGIHEPQVSETVLESEIFVPMQQFHSLGKQVNGETQFLRL